MKRVSGIAGDGCEYNDEAGRFLRAFLLRACCSIYVPLRISQFYPYNLSASEHSWLAVMALWQGNSLEALCICKLKAHHSLLIRTMC